MTNRTCQQEDFEESAASQVRYTWPLQSAGRSVCDPDEQRARLSNKRTDREVDRFLLKRSAGAYERRKVDPFRSTVGRHSDSAIRA